MYSFDSEYSSDIELPDRQGSFDIVIGFKSLI